MCKLCRSLLPPAECARFNKALCEHTHYYITVCESRQVFSSTEQIKWISTDLENTAYPEYLGVNQDRTLSYKEHIQNANMKVATRKNLPRKLANSKWGRNANTTRPTVLVKLLARRICSTSMFNFQTCVLTGS